MARRACRPGFAPAAVFFLLALATPLSAGAAPDLQMPLACRLGQDCWIVQYVDTEKETGKAADPQCGPRTEDGHEGTDFALRDLAAARRGVDVRAAAAGTVMRARDGSADRVPAPAEKAALLAEKKGCGNGILIDHGEGWQTIYCHLKQGSLKVKDGQAVKAGDAIAQAGYSGAADFAHLHFGLFHGGRTVDPFTGAEDGAGCGGGSPLWIGGDAPRYEDITLYAAGFSAGPPDFEALKDDAAAPEALASPSLSALHFWGGMFGVRAGDRVRMEIVDAAGRTIAARDSVQEAARLRQFYSLGRRFPPGRLPPGDYTGRLILTRGGVDGAPPLSAVITRTVRVAP